MNKELKQQLPGDYSSNQYQILFEKNPQPMWVYDVSTYQILTVNDAAIKRYGYSRNEFLSMTIKDIRPEEDIPRLENFIEERNQSYTVSKDWRHVKKDGTVIDVEVESHSLNFYGKNARLVLMTDVTEFKRTEEKNRYYANIVKSSNDAIIGKDLNGIVSSWNEAAEKMYGYLADEIIGKSISIIFPPERQEELNYIIDQIKKGDEIYHYETDRLRKDGTKIDVSITVSPIFNSDGVIIGASDITRNITRSKKIQAERDLLFEKEKEARIKIEKNQARLEFLSEASKILSSSLNYKKTLSTIAKIAVPHICDWCVIDILNDEDKLKRVAVVHTDPAKVETAYKQKERYKDFPAARKLHYQVLESGKALLLNDLDESYIKQKFHDENLAQLVKEIELRSAIIVPMKSRNKVLGVMVLIHAESNRKFTQNDLTYAEEIGLRAGMAIENSKLYTQSQNLNAELEKRVKERTIQLENTNKELETFSYSVSHDLRAPLRAIEGFLNIFLDEYSEKLDAEGERLLNVVISNTAKMGNLIDDLLNFSRVSRAGISMQQIDMEKLFENTFDELKNSEQEREIDFKIENLPKAYGDYSMIHQVAINLISNAIKFTRPREVAKIKIGTTRIDDENCYYIKDNGVGFDMEYVDNLFNVFQRLHKPKDFEGTGVGLALVKRIITKHGGKIWAESNLNEGTRFYFTMPER